MTRRSIIRRSRPISCFSWLSKKPYLRFFSVYIGIIVFVSILLNIPGFKKGTGSVLDRIFVAVSSVTTTGLSAVDVKESFTVAGQIVIFVTFWLGGLVTLIYLIKFFDKSSGLSLNSSFAESGDRNREKTRAKGVIKIGSIFILGSWFIGTIVLLFCFFFTDSNNNGNGIKGKWLESFWAAAFHAGSAINNTGLDIVGSDGMKGYSGAKGIPTIMTLWFLSVVGGIGFPVFYDVWLFGRKKGHFLTLFTKLSLISYFTMTIGGIVLVMLFECVGKGMAGISNSWKGITMTIFARSSGFGTMDVKDLTEPSQLLIAFLMFIGASPASLGGGVRSMVFFLILWKGVCMLRNLEHVSIFWRKINEKEISNFLFITCVSIFIVLSFGVMVYLFQGSTAKGVFPSIFESFSAFGNSGLSYGVTKASTVGTKILLMLLMCLGHVGPTNILLPFAESRNRNNKNIRKNIRYPEERVWMI